MHFHPSVSSHLLKLKVGLRHILLLVDLFKGTIALPCITDMPNNTLTMKNDNLCISGWAHFFRGNALKYSFFFLILLDFPLHKSKMGEV